MAARQANGENRRRRLDREIEQYREAAGAALGQLEWVVRYLYEIRRPELARVIDRNRRRIIERMG